MMYIASREKVISVCLNFLYSDLDSFAVPWCFLCTPFTLLSPYREQKGEGLNYITANALCECYETCKDIQEVQEFINIITRY